MADEAAPNKWVDLPAELGHSGAVSLLVAKFAHLLGIAMAIGGAIAIQTLVALARANAAAQKAGVEQGAKKLAVAVELPGLFLALLAGIGLVIAHPGHLSVAESGAGPWLHVKLLFVLLVLVVSHLRMFRLARLVRTRADAASEAECEQLLGGARKLGLVAFALYLTILVIATFRVVLFR